MKHIGLFEGIGGFSLAACLAGWETVACVEIDPKCQNDLKRNFPDATIFGDIHEFDGRQFAGQIDIITGGFPCQPFSTAGQRRGTADDRYLWPEMLRVIGEIKPRWIVGENVAAIYTMDGGRVYTEIRDGLEALGYTVEAYCIPALAAGASHRRDRAWIIAYADSLREPQLQGMFRNEWRWDRDSNAQPFAYAFDKFGDRSGQTRDGRGKYSDENARPFAYARSRGWEKRGFGPTAESDRATNEHGNDNGRPFFEVEWQPDTEAELLRVGYGLP